MIATMLGNDLIASTRAMLNFNPAAINYIEVDSFSSSVPIVEEHSENREEEVSSAKDEETSPSNNTAWEARLKTTSIAYLGYHHQDPLHMPEDDFFEFTVPEDFKTYKNVILEYDIQGLEDGHNIPKSVNGRPVYYGSSIEPGTDWQRVSVELNEAELKPGNNTIRFGMPEGFGSSVTVKNVDLLFTNDESTAPLNDRMGRIEASEADFTIEERLDEDRLFELLSMDMPSIPNDIKNVTQGADGFLLESFKKDSARITIAYQSDVVPSGSGMSRLHLFYFDDERRTWKVASNLNFDPIAGTVTGQAPSNTDYFAGLISSPEMPEASAFVPTAISDIKAANPAAGISMINPPSASRTGEASVSYPIDIPAGRAGLTPSLMLNYSSDGGAGWLGIGWSINVPQVAVETSWGVPTFGTGETEGYLLNGSALYMEGGLRPNKTAMSSSRASGDVQFIERTINSYKTITRKGSAPNNYYWVEKHADGTEYFYGTTDGTSFDASYVLSDGPGGNIVKWFLAMTKDRWGNYIKYYYDIGTENSATDAKKDGHYAVLSKIAYTGFDGGDAPRYIVEFKKTKDRQDATINLKAGIKELDYHSLNNIKIRYVDPNLSNDTVEISRYHMTYGNGDFGKKTLLSITKYDKNDDEFHEHSFTYHTSGNRITYGNPTPINTNIGPFNNLFSGMDDKIKKIALPLSQQAEPSSINSSVTSGWGAGGSVGLGVCFTGSSFIPTKAWTFSGSMGLSQSVTQSKINLDDFNGDGLPDIMFDAGIHKAYLPLKTQADGSQFFGKSRRISQPGSLNESMSISFSTGVNFAMPLNALYYGLNYNNNRSFNYRYLTDYNADGFKDLVNQGVVYFGRMNQAGDYSFDVSSEQTPNPVIKGTSASTYTDDESLPDLQMVRTWEAPMDGYVNISGTATCDVNTVDGLRLGIQKGSTFLVAMTDVSGSSSLNMVANNVHVNRGEKILFRTQSKNNGYSDLAYWNPKVKYTNNLSRVDPNGIDYAESTYEDGFMLSASQGVITTDDKYIKVSWPALNSSVNLTDDVTFRISALWTPNGGTSSSVFSFSNKISAGSPLNLTGNFVDNNGNPANFVNSFLKIPGYGTGGEWNVFFQVLSSSNVDWKAINWRPEVSFGDDPCGLPTRKKYPSVMYHTYNKVLQLEASYPVTTSGAGSDQMRFWPVVSFSNVLSAFTTDEISEGSPKYAWFVSKTAGGLLSKMVLKINTNGTYAYYTDKSYSQVVTQASSSTVYGFSREQVLEGTAHVGWFCQDKLLGAFLRSSTSSISYKNLTQGGIQEATSVNFDVFAINRTALQDYHLGWGQFCWNDADNPDAPIGVSEMQLNSSMISEEKNYQKNEPEISDMQQEITESSPTPATDKFHMLIARRWERPSRLPSYIKENYANGSDEKLDCWSAWNGHEGVYANDGATSPGKFAESPRMIKPTVPANSGNYLAEGIPIVTTSNSLADNVTAAAGLLGQSETRNIGSAFNSKPQTAYLDINGDGYPDIIKYDNSDPKMQVTVPLGGYANETDFFDSDGNLGKSISESVTMTIAGSFANNDKRFMKTGNVSGSAGLGSNYSEFEWLDINGDGLPDRVSSDNSTDILIEYNRGNGLFEAVSVNTSLSQSSLNKSNSTSGSLGLGLSSLDDATDKVGGSFSAGIGLNVTGGEVAKQFIDYNGDGLLDIAVSSGSAVSVYYNLGTEWSGPFGISGIDLGKSEALGVYGNIAGTYSFPSATVPPGASIKTSLSGNAQANFALNKTNSTLRDMNGDNIPDIVSSDGFGKLSVRYATNVIGNSNLLSTVTNPLGGSFSINYHREGNKYGNYPVAIKTSTSADNEVMVWDMPYSKWVLSQVVIDDGLDLQDQGEDIDGADDIQLSFKYDGGIKSRRERDFIGFTRVQTLREADNPMPTVNTDPIARYTSTVVEYFRPSSTSPQEIRKAEYLKGYPFFNYNLYHEEGWCDVEGDLVPCPLIQDIKRTKNTYEYRNVIQSGSSIGMLEKPYDEFVLVNANALSETQTIFPALIEKEDVTFPDYQEESLFHSLVYELDYDEYTNVTWYSRKGSNVISGVSDAIVGVIDNSEYEYLEDNSHFYGELYGFTYPFNDFVVDPNTGEVCFTLHSDDFGHHGYEDINICVPEYEFQSPNSCTSQGGDNPPIELVFRKYVVKTTNITKKQYDCNYHAPIIAEMDYFPLDNKSDYRANVLKSHKIFIGVNNSPGFRRGTSVELTGNGKGVAKIKNELNFTGSSFTQTDLLYDGFGNVTKITSPNNLNNERLVTNYEYETDCNQFVKRVWNSYGDEACYKYEQRTGNLLRQVGINGHATAYQYDGKDRLKAVYGPREYANPGSAATISFEYYPEGTAGGTVPVAITSHNMGVSGTMASNPPSINCDSDDNFSSRPSMSQVMQTATFIDGMSRVVQVKKDAAGNLESSGVYSYKKVREVSGITAYDYLGRDSVTTLSMLEDGADPISVINTGVSSTITKSVAYDYVGKPILHVDIREQGATVQTQIKYSWSEVNTPFAERCFNIETKVNSNRTYTNFINAEGQTIARQTKGNSSGVSQFTTFEFDALGQLLSSTDPIELETTYGYDAFGRITYEIHPDRGRTDFTYDNAGNLIKQKTPLTGTAGITMDYEYNRIKKRVMADSESKKTYNVYYSWGSEGDGKNGAGRVVSVNQGSQNTVKEEYTFDELGNRITEEKQIWTLDGGTRKYDFQYKYDSWGRMREIVYPDAEILTYNYTPTGELLGMDTHHEAANPMDASIVDNIYYDGFGNIVQLNYSNGTTTDFEYDSYSRRLTGLNLLSGTGTLWSDNTTSRTNLLTKDYTYDPYGNVKTVGNEASGFDYDQTLGFALFGIEGGEYDMQYNYDDLNRLSSASGMFDGRPLDLSMTYDDAGGLLTKNQDFDGIAYELEYELDTEEELEKRKSHQINSITDHTTTDETIYHYDDAGNVIQIDLPNEQQDFIWNELNHLRGVMNDNGISHYVYDQNGERIMKGNYLSSQGGSNESFDISNMTLDGYTLYVNPYYVVTNYNNTAEGSKHYYMGSQRIASGQMSYTLTPKVDFPPESYSPTSPETPGGIVDLHDLFSKLAVRRDQAFDIDLSTLLEAPELSDLKPFEAYEMAVNESPCQTLECRCAESIYWTEQSGEDCEAKKVMYWYHPDYLGNTEYVTNSGGLPHQFFWYSPWGEPLVSQDLGFLSGFRSRYKFNAKELDEETGNYYYGARYYNPQTSVWLGVDAMAAKYPSLSPYTFVANNPIMLIDPDGNQIDPALLDENSPNYCAETAQAFLDFAQTKEGQTFLSDYASEGQTIAGVTYSQGKYDKEGLDVKFDSKIITNKDGTISSANGVTDVDLDGERGKITISLNTASTNENNSNYLSGNIGKGEYMYNLVGTITHEAFIHGDLFAADFLDGGGFDYSNVPSTISGSPHHYASRRAAQNGNGRFYNQGFRIMGQMNTKYKQNYSREQIVNKMWHFRY